MMVVIRCYLINACFKGHRDIFSLDNFPTHLCFQVVLLLVQFLQKQLLRFK